MGDPGSILHGMLHFRWTRRIRFRIPRRPKIEYSTAILAHWAGKWRPILRSTLKKPKENQGFWLQPLKNLRKINVFGSWPLLGPMGRPGGPHGHHMGARGGPMGDQGRPIRAKAYIHKLPIHRHRAAAAGKYSDLVASLQLTCRHLFV